MSYFDYTVTKQDGTTTSLDVYRGKVLLIVNTATGCGFTPQYDDLERIYAKYRDRGLNHWTSPATSLPARRESDDEIHQFCTMKFGTEFPSSRRSRSTATAPTPCSGTSRPKGRSRALARASRRSPSKSSRTQTIGSLAPRPHHVELHQVPR